MNYKGWNMDLKVNKILSTPIGGSIQKINAIVLFISYNPKLGKSGLSKVLVREKELDYEFYIKQWGEFDASLIGKEVVILNIQVQEFRGERQYLAKKIIDSEYFDDYSEWEFEATNPNETSDTAWEIPLIHRKLNPIHVYDEYKYLKRY